MSANNAVPTIPERAGGARRIYLAFFYSMAGFRAVWRTEAAFRQETILASIMIPLSLILGESYTDHILLIGSVVLVLIVELINSSIEAVVDRIGTDFHELSGRAKDIGSAAVFLALIFALFVWIVKVVSRFYW